MTNKTQPSIGETEIFWETMPHIQRATMPPYFYTRLQAKLAKSTQNQNSVTNQLWQQMIQPKIAAFVFAFFITMQLLIFANLQPTKTLSAKTNRPTLEAFAEEYNFTFSSYNYTKK